MGEKFTLDAVLADAKDQTTDRRGCKAISEFHRVVAPDGLLLSIAWGEGKREELLRGGSLFDVEMTRLPGQATQRPILYVCRKRPVGKCSSGLNVDAPSFPRTNGRGPDSKACASSNKDELDEPVTNGASMSSTAPFTSKTNEVHRDSPFTAVIKEEKQVNAWIEFAADVRKSDVEVDVGEDQVRWRLRCTGRDEWSHLDFPGRVYVDQARARWTHELPPVLTGSTRQANVGRRILHVSAPFATSSDEAP